MRLFIGVELSDDVKARAAAIADALHAQLGARVHARWIPVENLHITLWFIGEVDDEHGEAITNALNPPFHLAPFDLELRGAGAFPPSGPPRVFWIGARRGGDSMLALYNEVAARLKPLGFEAERRSYSAHLTIARVKEARRRDVRSVLKQIDADAGSCRVAAVTLFRSRLSPKGASYEARVRVPLGD